MIDDRIAGLKAKLAKRDGVPGYEKNVEAIRQEIERLEAIKTLPVASSDDPGSEGIEK